MAENVLITGGSGLVGSRLTHILQEKGFETAWLVRSPSKGTVRQFIWNVDKEIVDPEAIQWADHIIHLAGASVAEGRWSKARKKVLLESRTLSTRLLYNELKKQSKRLKSFVSASAMGLYGIESGEEWVEEDHPSGQDFLAQLTQQWEQEVMNIGQLGIREARIRISIVLSEKGGALPQMLMPVNMGLGSPLGSGKQYMSWIHLDDLCAVFVAAIQHEQYHGAINASASHPVKNKEFMGSLAKAVHKPFFLPAVPSLVLRLVLGEKHIIASGGCRLCNKKLLSKGFQIKFDDLDLALEDLIS